MSRLRYRRRNPPQTTAIARQRSNFSAPSAMELPATKLKKSLGVLNVGVAVATNVCGSGYPSPTAIFGASAHPPQAPIWLDPSGCPPGRVFHFHSVFEHGLGLDPGWV